MPKDTSLSYAYHPNIRVWDEMRPRAADPLGPALLRRWRGRCAAAVREEAASRNRTAPWWFGEGRRRRGFAHSEANASLASFLRAARAGGISRSAVFPVEEIYVVSNICYDGMNLRVLGRDVAAMTLDLCTHRRSAQHLGATLTRSVKGASVKVRSRGGRHAVMLPCGRDQAVVYDQDVTPYCALPAGEGRGIDPWELPSNVTWYKGVWALLNEYFAGTYFGASANVAHFARDVRFLASWLRASEQDPGVPRPAGVLLDRTHEVPNMNEWSRTVVEGYMSDQEGLPVMWTRTGQHACFEAVAGKLSMGPGSPDGADSLRAFARRTCGVVPPDAPTSVLLSRRFGTRELGNRQHVVQALQDLAKARGLTFVEMNFGSVDFCQQVYAVSRAAVIVAVHGAFFANSPFFHPRALVVEIMPAPAWFTHHAPETHVRTMLLDQCEYGQSNVCRVHVAQGQPYLLADMAAIEGPKGLCLAKLWLNNPHCKVNVPVTILIQDIVAALSALDAIRWFEFGRPPEPL